MSSNKPARFPYRDYLGHGVYFLTICCAQRRPLLAVSSTAESVLQTLLRSANAASFSIHAYCLMPDHIHILAEGTLPACDALEFVRRFKQQTAFHFKQTARQLLWQSSYYDHVLRSYDDIIEIARHIWWNPVRKKLCRDPAEYPFSGSQTMPWMQESRTIPTWSAPWHHHVAAGL